MESRRLGSSGLRVPALSFGTATFGGQGDFFKAWGGTYSDGASRLIEDERLYRIGDFLLLLAEQTGKTVPQIALNWLVQKKTASTVIIGARNEEQLIENIGAVGWSLSREQVEALDIASEASAAYPVWHQRGFPMLNERSTTNRS